MTQMKKFQALLATILFLGGQELLAQPVRIDAIGIQPVPFGACCNASGCVMKKPQNCNGTYLGNGTSCGTKDCNGDGWPNACDIAMGVSLDLNLNRVPDDCEIVCPVPCDAWETAGGTNHDFSFQCLPADFFEPGSDPFCDLVMLQGVPIDPSRFGSADTLVARQNDPISPNDPIGSFGSTEVKIRALRLCSQAPIHVTLNGGQPGHDWDISVGLSAAPETCGGSCSLYATKEYSNGGTYYSFLEVQPRFVFRRADNPAIVRVLDTGLNPSLNPLYFFSNDAPWAHDPGLGAVAARGVGGVHYTCMTTGGDTEPGFVCGVDPLAPTITIEVEEDDKGNTSEHTVSIPPIGGPPTGGGGGGTCEEEYTGACCFLDGDCEMETAEGCGEAMGAFQGVGTCCTPNPCDSNDCPPAGCNPDAITTPLTVNQTNNSPVQLPPDPVVTGGSCDEAFNQVPDPAGVTTATVAYEFGAMQTKTKHCTNGTWTCRRKATSLTITQDITIKLPAWTPDPGTPQADIDAFNDFLVALGVHEQGHADIDFNSFGMYVQNLSAAVEQVGCGNTAVQACSNADTRVAQELARAYHNTAQAIQGLHDQYHQTNGSTVKINCP